MKLWLIHNHMQHYMTCKHVCIKRVIICKCRQSELRELKRNTLCMGFLDSHDMLHAYVRKMIQPCLFIQHLDSGKQTFESIGIGTEASCSFFLSVELRWYRMHLERAEANILSWCSVYISDERMRVGVGAKE
jgi:hypothetical protein